MSLKALTLTQPWPAMFLLDDNPKRIENREWAPPKGVVGQYIALHGGRLPISRAALDEAIRALDWVSEYVHQDDASEPWDDQGVQDLCVTGIYGVARVVDVVTSSDDPWFTGTFGWVLADFVAIDPPVPCRGAQKLWHVPDDVLRLVRERWKAAKTVAMAPQVTTLPEETELDYRVPDLFCPGHYVAALPERLEPNRMYGLRAGDEWVAVMLDQSGKVLNWHATRAGTWGAGSRREFLAFFWTLGHA